MEPYNFLQKMTEESFVSSEDIDNIENGNPVSSDDDVPPTTDDIDKNATPGVESLNNQLSDYYHILKNSQQDVMAAYQTEASPSNSNPDGLFIRTTDDINFRLYLKTNYSASGNYVNRFCRFLDSRNPSQNVTIFMGCHHDDRDSYIIGAILSAVVSCPGNVHAVAAGLCGMPETLIWLFAKTREISEYGSLLFSGTHVIDTLSEYRYFLEIGFAKAKELDILTDEEIVNLWKSRNELLITYDRLKNKFGSTKKVIV